MAWLSKKDYKAKKEKEKQELLSHMQTKHPEVVEDCKNKAHAYALKWEKTYPPAWDFYQTLYDGCFWSCLRVARQRLESEEGYLFSDGSTKLHA